MSSNISNSGPAFLDTLLKNPAFDFSPTEIQRLQSLMNSIVQDKQEIKGLRERVIVLETQKDTLIIEKIDTLIRSSEEGIQASQRHIDAHPIESRDTRLDFCKK